VRPALAGRPYRRVDLKPDVNSIFMDLWTILALSARASRRSRAVTSKKQERAKVSIINLTGYESADLEALGAR